MIKENHVKTNYHTHNELCGHAGGTIEDYARAAVEAGMEEIGMSDHLPFAGDFMGARMPYAKFPYYIEETNRLKAAYKDSIRILLGAEAEYMEEQTDFYESLFRDFGLEYLILGQHCYKVGEHSYKNVFEDMHDTADVLLYAQSCIDGMRTGYFAYLAHPDLFTINQFPLDDNVKRAIAYMLDESVKHDYVLEWNANGLRRPEECYPMDYFWREVAKTNIRVIIGADCHSVDALNDWAVDESERRVKELGLNRIYTL
jgi:histidinol-phosphatase (PHP family)